MKRTFLLIGGFLGCLLLVAGAYLWATAIMDSTYAYRSPLHETPPPPGEPLGAPLVRRVVFVLVDGLREDTSWEPDVMPFLSKLRAQGAWATMHSRPPSYSAPSYSVLFTGAWPDLSDGPALNVEYKDMPTWSQDNLFSALRRTGLQTAISGHYWFERLVPQSSVSASYYTAGEDEIADRAVVDAALPWLEQGGYEFVLVHLDQVDYAGHLQGGPQDQGWKAAARRADDLVRQVAGTLDLSKDVLLVCSDHGHIDQGGHGGHDSVVLTEPFVLVGAGVRPGANGDINMVDVAPTLAAMLGANIPASSQGRVLEEMLLLGQDRQRAVQSALLAQQERLVELYQASIGRTVPVEPATNTVAAHQAALQQARTARLNDERLRRAILALPVLLVSAFLLLRKTGKELAGLLAGSALYALAFNLRYAVIDGRTYSLSSVVSADDLIAYVATTALVAMVMGWLVAAFGVRAFRRGPRQAAGLAIRFTLLTAYVVSLPAIWSFVWNGLKVTWTLPDMSTMFLAFLALIQVLFVAATGLLLAGASAGIAAIARHRGQPSPVEVATGQALAAADRADRRARSPHPGVGTRGVHDSNE
jgi:hypothetical protein